MAMLAREWTTTQQILCEIDERGCSLPMIAEVTKLKYDDLERAINGAQDIHVYERLIWLWCRIKVKEEKFNKLKDTLHEKRLRIIFDAPRMDKEEGVQ